MSSTAISNIFNQIKIFHNTLQSIDHLGLDGINNLSADEHFELKIDHIPISNDTIYDFSPGNYVAYVYDQKWYIGSISSIDKEQNELKVSSMHPHGPATCFFWPQRDDTVWAPLALVLTKIDCPALVSARGMYKLEKEELKRISNLWKAFQINQS